MIDDFVNQENGSIAEASSALWVIDRGPVIERSLPPRTMLISAKIECDHVDPRPALGRVVGTTRIAAGRRRAGGYRA